METIALEKMILSQIEARGVCNPGVLSAMRKVDRTLFVPTHARDIAYEYYPLSIGHGQTISQPYIVAFMTELLEPCSHHRVLKIGTGSGYQTAILASLVSEVYTVEIVEALSAQARNLLENLGYVSVHFRVDDGAQGWPDAAPCDGIIVTAAPDSVPPNLWVQLAPKGRLVIPSGPVYSQRLKIFVKKARGEIREEDSLPVCFVPMTGAGA